MSADQLTPEEKERVRYHMGYTQVSPATALDFGIPKPVQTLFLVEQSMDNLLPVAMPRVRQIIQRMDEIECTLGDVSDILLAEQAGDVRPRGDAGDLIDREYYRWACRLSDILGAPLYPLSPRFHKFAAGANVRVSH